MHATPETSGRTSNPESRRLTVGGAAYAATAAAAAGALGGWLLPRGPVTTVQALIAVLAAVVVGFTAAWLMRSRWALPLAPAVFALVYELVRCPSTDPRLTQSGSMGSMACSCSSSAGGSTAG